MQTISVSSSYNSVMFEIVVLVPYHRNCHVPIYHDCFFPYQRQSPHQPCLSFPTTIVILPSTMPFLSTKLTFFFYQICHVSIHHAYFVMFPINHACPFPLHFSFPFPPFSFSQACLSPCFHLFIPYSRPCVYLNLLFPSLTLLRSALSMRFKIVSVGLFLNIFF